MVEIIAHRGASHDAPENTLFSVRLAWQQGADAVEIDCRLTRDSQIVVIHDADTQRTAGARLVVAESTLTDLRRLQYGGWKGAEWLGEPLALLDEVIDTMPPGKRLLIEVKCGEEIVPQLVAMLRGSGRALADFAVISFRDPVVRTFKQALPDVVAYLVAETTPSRHNGGVAPSIAALLSRAKAAGADGLDLEASPMVSEASIAEVAAAGLDCLVWTVDSAQEARRLSDAGIQGITTNRPGWLREQLSASSG